MHFLKTASRIISASKPLLVLIVAAVGVAADGTAYAEGKSQKIEAMLAENWQFFAEGDVNRDGYWSKIEFMAHPGYEDSGFDLRLKTFVFWMVDDNKDSQISLQEWFNNEIGQFQLGDIDHDGIMTAKEHEALEKIENKLFSDLKSK